MPSVIKFDWTTVDCTNSDLSIAIKRDGTSFYSAFIRANKHSFFYDITDSDLWSDTTKYTCSIYTNYAWTHGDNTLAANAYVQTISIIQGNEYGQLSISTANSVELSKIDSLLETNNSVNITRTDSSQFIFFDSDITALLPEGGFADISNMYTYDMYTYGCLGRTTPDGTGVLRIFKDSSFASPAIGAELVIRAVTNGLVGQNHLNVYINSDYTSDFSSYFLGEISEATLLTNGPEHRFVIPSDLLFTLVSAQYKNATIAIEHLCGAEWEEPDSTFYIYDVYLDLAVATDTSLSTSNTVLIYDATALLAAPQVITANAARIHTGTVYTVVDYYTPGVFWDFTVGTLFSYSEWNTLEEILQQFGRMTHSLCLFNSQLPEFATISLVADSTSASISSVESYQSSIPTITRKSGGFSIYFLDTESYLSLFSPQITPNIVVSDSTTYRLVPYISDGTININIYAFDGTTYVLWDNSSQYHPFITDTTFYVSLLGKR